MRQYQAIVDRAAAAFRADGTGVPPEGWLATARKALGMSGAELARRLRLSRARVSSMEHSEPDGGVTLRSMQAAADAMGCRFVYAVVPKQGDTGDALAVQARRKATAIVAGASNHMALESQSLSEAQNEAEIERLAQELLRTMPSDFWKEE